MSIPQKCMRIKGFKKNPVLQVLNKFIETERRGKKGKTELRLRGLTGHEAAEKVIA